MQTIEIQDYARQLLDTHGDEAVVKSAIACSRYYGHVRSAWRGRPSILRGY